MMENRKIFVLTLCWMFVGATITVYDHLILHASISSGAGAGYSLYINLLINVTVAFLAGITGGAFIVKFINEKYRHIEYWKSLLLVVLSFLIVSSSLIVFISVVQTLLQTGGRWNITILKSCLSDPLHFKNLVIWSLVVGGTQLMLQINDKFGQGVLYSLIVGRYHQPREETRIFMMVDIKSSTSIAEKLGNDQYHLFLRDFFADVTHSILINRGEIYQYVGDEIVISWKLNENDTDNRCLKCYFDMRSAISEEGEKYMTRYGVTPDFKVGLHYGKVIAGEIGIIKKDITYSGDVLNTTSRIHDKCNKYDVKILTSNALLELLPYNDHFHRTSIGKIKLRGKKRKVSVSTLEMRESLSHL